MAWWGMRYPLFLFVFVFVIPPFAVHALLTGKAVIDSKPVASTTLSATPEHTHHWRVAAAR